MNLKAKSNNPIPVILLLGGKGSRFSKINQEPKQLVKLNKNNLLTSILLYFKKYNLNFFILPLGYKHKYFENFFTNKKNIKKYSFNIIKNKNDYLKKNSINIKLFNANKNSSKLTRIYKSLNYFNHDYFLVTYGDGLANINFNKQIKFFKKIGNKNLVSVNKIRSQYGHIIFSKNKKVLNFMEKPYFNSPINIGYYIFNRRDLIYNYNVNHELETEYLPKLIKKKLLYTYCHKGFFFNIDNRNDLVNVKKKFKDI